VRALTVCQPYATLIMSGDKRVENRTWPVKYRGRIYIHAGKSREWLSVRSVDGVDFCAMTQRPVAELPFGFVLGVATLVDCLPIHEIREGKHDRTHPWLREHQHTEGPWCWIFAPKPQAIDPVPWKGAQGVFDINPLTLEDVARGARINS
jgi:hypothetical protein